MYNILFIYFYVLLCTVMLQIGAPVEDDEEADGEEEDEATDLLHLNNNSNNNNRHHGRHHGNTAAGYQYSRKSPRRSTTKM